MARLEDNDSWNRAEAIKRVAAKHNISVEELEADIRPRLAYTTERAYLELLDGPDDTYPPWNPNLPANRQGPFALPKKEGRDYIFGDSLAAVNLSKMIYENHPEQFRRVARVMNNINALIKKGAAVEDGGLRSWLYKAIRKHIAESFETVEVKAVATHARNVLISNLRSAFNRTTA